MSEEVKHITVNGKYKVQFERSAVKGVDGFKAEVNGDDMQTVMNEATQLYEYAESVTKTTPNLEVKEGK